MNEAQDGLKLIETMRKAWLDCYEYKESTQYDKHFSLIQLDKIDSYINKYFGKQKWEVIVK